MTTTQRQTAIAGYPVEATAAQVDAKFNPKYYQYTLDNIDRAYTANCPTLYGYAKKFGMKSAAAWVLIHLTALYNTSSNRDPNAIATMTSFSEAFAAQVKGFKLSELMIFFARYHAGRYGSSYFDCRRIGNAFFKEFLPRRDEELYRIESQRSKEASEKSAFRAPNGYTALSLYLKIKKMADEGSITARDYLEGKVMLTDEEMEAFLNKK